MQPHWELGTQYLNLGLGRVVHKKSVSQNGYKLPVGNVANLRKQKESSCSWWVYILIGKTDPHGIREQKKLL